MRVVWLCLSVRKLGKEESFWVLLFQVLCAHNLPVLDFFALRNPTCHDHKAALTALPFATSVVTASLLSFCHRQMGHVMRQYLGRFFHSSD